MSIILLMINSTRQLAVCTLCLGIGLGAGYLLPRGEGEVGAAEGQNTRQSERVRQDPAVNRRAANRFDDSGAMVGLPLDGGTDPVTVPTSLIRAVTKTKPIESCREPLFQKDDEVENLLLITPHEKEEMVQLWERERQRVESLEVKSSRSTVNDDGSVTISVPDLSQALGPVGDAFGAEIEQIMGTERGRLFLALKQVEKVFKPESGPRSYHVSVESVGDGKWRYQTKYTDAHDQRLWLGDGIPNKIRHITDAAQIHPTLSEAIESQ